MQRPLQDDVQRLRETLGLRIDAATKAVGDALHAAADLFVAIACAKAGVGSGNVASIRADERETQSGPSMLTSEQAAEYLGVQAQTLAVWRCTRRHTVPFVKVGRNVRYRKTDLDRYLQEHTKHRDGEDDLG